MEQDKRLTYHKLLKAVSEGDQSAFSTLYDLFAPQLTQHILSKISHAEVAEDLLHDLFLSLWKNRSHLADIESLPAYLYSSCRYLILAYYRKRQELHASEDSEELDLLDEDVPLEDRLHYRYLIDIVDREIDNLPEKCKEVFKLSRYEYLSNREIAERLAISESTVEKHINKAIGRLRSKTRYLTLLF